MRGWCGWRCGRARLLVVLGGVLGGACTPLEQLSGLEEEALYEPQAPPDGGPLSEAAPPVGTDPLPDGGRTPDGSPPPGGGDSPEGGAPAGPPPGSLTGRTVVTLGFSDGFAEQLQVLPWLEAHGFKATFWVISSALGRRNALTVEQLRAIAAAGHEIGGHTLDHAPLDALSGEEQRRQVCDDRAQLMALGFAVTSFGYPFGETSGRDTQRIIAECNYNSARRSGGIGTARTLAAEPIPPRNVWDIRLPSSVRDTDTVEDLQRLVLQAEEAGGGWLLFNFHHVGPRGSATYNITPEELQAFLEWLAPRASRGTVVRTQHQVVGGPLRPAVRASDLPPLEEAPP